MIADELVHEFALVARSTVNKQNGLVKTFDDLFAVLDELLLGFPLKKCVNQRTLRPGSKHVRIFSLEIYGRRRATPFASPASRDAGKESKRGFILAAHNKTFFPIVACDPPSFFLNASCSSLLGDL